MDSNLEELCDNSQKNELIQIFSLKVKDPKVKCPTAKNAIVFLHSTSFFIGSPTVFKQMARLLLFPILFFAKKFPLLFLLILLDCNIVWNASIYLEIPPYLSVNDSKSQALSEHTICCFFISNRQISFVQLVITQNWNRTKCQT